MFHLHYDTDLDRLADRLAELLARRAPANLLVPQTILVPQAGLERWLVQRMAEQHGIAANLEFLMPGQMVWRVLCALHPDLPERSAFDAGLMRWRLLSLLESLPTERPELASWIAGEPPTLRRFQLAGRLAEVYRRYQGYRRDLLLDWERGADAHDPQAILWRALVAGTDESPRGHLLGDFLREQADGGDKPLPGMQERLFVFGCINVSPDVLRFFGTLGRHAELHFFLPTPCREYWGDVRGRRAERAALCEMGGAYFAERDNPLLVSLGGVGRDFVAQVYGYDAVVPDEETTPPEVDPLRDTLLHRVQADVIMLAAPAVLADAPDPGDRSLTIHACHSPLREVQVLHDALLDMFEDTDLAPLEPRDIAVLVPDLAAYAPCVDAVFGALPADDSRRIPWTVADRPAAGSHAIVGMFLRLLDLPTMRLALDEVLDVLEVPAVARSCGIEPAELKDLRERLLAAGVRWGEDETDRAAAGLPATREYSWAFGRDRLLTGYLLGDDDDDTALVDGIAPLRDVEGRAALVLGEALRLQRRLRRLREELHREREAADWQALLNRVVETLVPMAVDHDEERALDAIHAALATLAEDAEAAGCRVALDWRSLRDFLGACLAEPPRHQRFLAGGVSVCGMVPLRNVPFKVICVLGLNAGDFPRQDMGDALDRVHGDLLADRRRVGDRSIRDDDRYLFLQTLMAARDRLYLSYTGVDARKGTDLEPSIVLDELLSTVCRGYFHSPDAARQQLVVRHPLQPFSPRLFDGADARLYTYRHEWQADARGAAVGTTTDVFVDAPLAPPEPQADVIALADLAQWLAKPQRMFLQHRAGIALAEGEGDAAEREPLTSAPLLQSWARQVLFETLCTQPHANADAVRDALRAQALLPPLALGREQFDTYWDDVQPQARYWAALAPDGIVPGEPFDLPLADGIVLQGRLPDATTTGVVPGWVGSERSAERWIRWWVALLARQAKLGATEGIAFGARGSDIAFPCRLKMPSQSGAKTHLDELVSLYRQSQCEPPAFTARAAWHFVRLWDDDAGDVQVMRDKALVKAREEWRKTLERDPWVALALRGRDPLPEAGDTTLFETQARTVFEPLWRAIRGGRGA